MDGKELRLRLTIALRERQIAQMQIQTMVDALAALEQAAPGSTFSVETMTFTPPAPVKGDGALSGR